MHIWYVSRLYPIPVLSHRTHHHRSASSSPVNIHHPEEWLRNVTIRPLVSVQPIGLPVYLQDRMDSPGESQRSRQPALEIPRIDIHQTRATVLPCLKKTSESTSASMGSQRLSPNSTRSSRGRWRTLSNPRSKVFYHRSRQRVK